MIHDPALPPPFAERFAPLTEVKFSGPRSSFHNCFGCGPGHDIGLRVRTFTEDGGVLAPIVIPRRFEGPPGAAHGGIVAAYLDEVLAGAAVSHTGRLYVTGELTVRYVKPVPIEAPLEMRARLVDRERRKLFITAECRDGDEIVATCKAIYITVDPSRFAGFPDPR